MLNSILVEIACLVNKGIKNRAVLVCDVGGAEAGFEWESPAR